MIDLAMLFGGALALAAFTLANVVTWGAYRSAFWGREIGGGWRMANLPVGGALVAVLAVALDSAALGAAAMGLAWGAIEMRWVLEDDGRVG